jgi:hypothetical protein
VLLRKPAPPCPRVHTFVIVNVRNVRNGYELHGFARGVSAYPGNDYEDVSPWADGSLYTVNGDLGDNALAPAADLKTPNK